MGILTDQSRPCPLQHRHSFRSTTGPLVVERGLERGERSPRNTYREQFPARMGELSESVSYDSPRGSFSERKRPRCSVGPRSHLNVSICCKSLHSRAVSGELGENTGDYFHGFITVVPLA